MVWQVNGMLGCSIVNLHHLTLIVLTVTSGLLPLQRLVVLA